MLHEYLRVDFSLKFEIIDPFTLLVCSVNLMQHTSPSLHAFSVCVCVHVFGTCQGKERKVEK